MAKRWLLSIGMILFSGLATAADFQGAIPSPMGKVADSIGQLQIQFPSAVVKSDSFQVSCNPQSSGQAAWSANDTLWTYNFTVKESGTRPSLTGGTVCKVTQTAPVKGVNGTVWAAGTINYSVNVAGPNVTKVIPAQGFDGLLREKDPVLLITFDGPVDSQKFFANQSAYLSYASGNAPAEKLQLKPVPDDAIKKIFAYIASGAYIDDKVTDKTWVLATVQRDLIPGSTLNLNVSGVVSSYDPNVVSDQVFTQQLTVRSGLKAEVKCGGDERTPDHCLPQVPVELSFNGKLKWSDVKGAYISYIPYGAKNDTPVRAYAKLPDPSKASIYDDLSNYFPYVAQFSDTVVDSLTFDVSIKPESVADVNIDLGLKDIDGRSLTNAAGKFTIHIGAMTEMIVVPQSPSFYEKTATGHLKLPIAIVNLNQKIEIRTTGTDSSKWTPIRDIPTIISVIRKYDERGDSRETKHYTSPLETLNVPSVVKTTPALPGKKNKGIYLQYDFGAGADGKVGGFYALEISSPTYEKLNSSEKEFYNPRYSLAQVTDVSVHIKHGTTQSLIWVTSLSKGTPTANAEVDIYNCNGQRIKGARTDAHGLATIANEKWATSCQGVSPDQGSIYSNPDQFFVAAKVNDDFALTHSSWDSSSNSPWSAPGVDYFYSDITENQPYYHSVIGVNLVKPGQKVPVQILVKNPQIRGYAELAVRDRAKTARVISDDDSKIYFDFPLTWQGSSASFEWQVPAAGSAKLGTYSIQLFKSSAQDTVTVQSGGGIEVAEFKVPLMSGYLNLPTAALVRPDSIALNGLVRYANKTGVANLNVDISYYFEPTTVDVKKFPGFAFGSGVASVATPGQSTQPATVLPTSNRPATVPGPLKTNASGVVTTDLAAQTLPSGQSVADAIKAVSTPQKLVTRLRYQDSMGEYQTLSQEKTVFNSKTYVGTKLSSSPHAKLQVAVVDVDGHDVSSNANLEMSVFSIETKVIGEELFGGLIKSDLVQTMHATDWTANCTAASNILSCDIGSLPAGSYAFQANAKAFGQASNTLFKIDSDGNVTGDDSGVLQSTQKQLPLALDKAQYKNGDTAVVSFVAPFRSCNALVTIERSDVVESYVVEHACEKGSVKVPVDATYAPNAFVSIYAITGRAQQANNDAIGLGELDLGRPTYRLGYANLKVDWTKFEAKVAVTTDKPVYKPNDEVTVNVAVAPEEGQLKNATVSVVAIEEKILEIKPNDSYAVLDALMQLRSDTVDTITPLERVQSPAATKNADAALGAPGGRKGGNEGGDGGSALRRKLSDALVHFEAGVPVVNGVAQVKFKATNNLTKFKIIAIATSESQKFGMGSAEYLSQQDTQSVGNFPNVAYNGDKFPLTVTVQNNGNANQVYKTEIVVKYKDAAGNVVDTKTFTAQQPVNKGSGTSVQVAQITVPDKVASLEYNTNVYDSSGKVVDRMGPDVQTVLPTLPLAIHSSYIRQVDNSNSLTQVMNKENGALPDKGEIRVTLASSLVNSALAQIKERMDQDTFVDFFIESRIYKALEQSTATNPAKLKTALNSLMVNLDSEGLVKFYPKADKGSVWLTAALINVLQTEPWAMEQVPPAAMAAWKGAIAKVLSKSLDPSYIENTPMSWMQAQVQMGVAAYAFKDEELQATAKTLAQAFAASLVANPNAFGEPINQWNNSALVNFWMLQVYANPSQALSSPVYATLTSAARLRYSGNSAVLQDRPSFWFGSFYTDGTVQTSQLLYGLAKLNNNTQVTQSVAVGLVNSNTDAWYAERSLAWVAQSLKNYQASTGGTVTGSTGVVVTKDNANATVHWTHATTTSSVTSPWTNSTENVQVTHTGTGHPWISIQGLTAVKLDAPTGPLAIDKKIRNASRDSQTFQAGDMIEVTLTINSPTPVGHIAMLDPIPSGSNILAEAYGSYDSGEKSYQGYKFYFDSLSAGASVVKYQYQLNNSGTFNLPPTRAEGLYMPSVYGEAPNVTMTVSPQQ